MFIYKYKYAYIYIYIYICIYIYLSKCVFTGIYMSNIYLLSRQVLNHNISNIG